jgi:prepilin-type N-terminal cleavage/methylation domain-containing protein
MEREWVNRNRLPTDVGSKRRSEDGFTLIELIISVVILTMITGAISVAFVTSINSSGATNARVHTSNDAQVIAAFLVRDAQAAGSVDPTNPMPQGDPTLGVTLGNPTAGATFTDPSGCGSGVLVFRFAWRDRATSTVSHLHVANYFYLTGTKQLVRTTCTDSGPSTTVTIGNNITSLLPSCNPAACPVIPDSVSLTITETNNATAYPPSTYTFTLQATVRTQGEAQPSGATTTSLPSILSLGGCSTGTSSGTQTPGLTVTGNSTAGIFGPVVVNASDTNSPSCNAMNVSGAKVAYFAPTTSLLGDGSCTGNQCPTVNHNVSALPDPYSTLPAPGDCSSPAGTRNGNNYTPGAFSGPVSINSSAVFVTGNYIFCGGVTFSGTVNATSGVLFYVANGPVSIGGTLTITPQSSGIWAGLSLWIPASNIGITSLGLSGGSVLVSATGTFYAPNVDFSVSGLSKVAFQSIIARTVSIASNNTSAHVGPAATIGSPSPTAGSAGTSASISGTNFLPASAVTVKVGSTTATITAGAATDPSGNMAATFTVPNLPAGTYPITVSDNLEIATSPTSFTVVADTTPPVVTTLVSQDTNADGKVDHVIATFDDNLAPCTAPCTTGWTLTSPPAGTTLQSVTVSGKVATLNLAGTTAVDTAAASMQVALSAASGITDSTGNHSSFGPTSVADGMGPVLVAITNVPGTTAGRIQSADGLTLVFSEALKTTSVPASVIATESRSNNGSTFTMPGLIQSAAINNAYLGGKNSSGTATGTVSLTNGNKSVAITLGTVSTTGSGVGTGTTAVSIAPNAALQDLSGNGVTGTAASVTPLF